MLDVEVNLTNWLARDGSTQATAAVYLAGNSGPTSLLGTFSLNQGKAHGEDQEN